MIIKHKTLSFAKLFPRYQKEERGQTKSLPRSKFHQNMSFRTAKDAYGCSCRPTDVFGVGVLDCVVACFCAASLGPGSCCRAVD